MSCDKYSSVPIGSAQPSLDTFPYLGSSSYSTPPPPSFLSFVDNSSMLVANTQYLLLASTICALGG